MDEKTLKEIAYLSRLEIESSQIESFLGDFNKIMDYVDQVKELDVSSIKEEDLYPNFENATREDKVENSLSRDDISKISPKFENGYIVVPRVIET
ncbi:MAG: Asp-tRNA(Asn)/Glu-tRNA(Gln) amidotransferase subunit GatC [Leptospiraceae bacterium]|nr:Asp-tRNA(Asn)/Glu-tRNA(Gln) amidotransferase subunit GatC [Leptospiraceae bacterium]